jgi:hypothetical protein
MPPINYRVSEAAVVTERFRQLLDRAEAEGRLPLVVRATQYMMDELAYAPFQLGESREFRASLQLHVRLAFVPPLQVEFAVHEPCRQVFILRVGLQS